MTPFSTKKRRARALLAAVALAAALPASTIGAGGYRTSEPAYVAFTSAVSNGGKIIPLINSGEDPFGLPFEGLPDGLGVVPGPLGSGYVDLYVAHEQSRVPFGTSASTVFADFQDSTVTRVRIDVSTRSIIEMDEALPASAGFIRFCSAFMAGPAEGFSDYTLFLNEESSDALAGRALGQAGYSVVLNPDTGAYTAVPGLGRMNHENSVVVPGGWSDIAIVTGDDTFSAPSSQLYLYTAANEAAIWGDTGDLWAFQVTATGAGPLADATDPFNGANDYGDMHAGDVWSGHFIHVDDSIADGDQAGLEAWSNAHNVFQFIRIEDLAYDPAHPRTIYFADTGEARALTDAQWGGTPTGRLHRGSSSGPFGDFGNGRIFKMTFNADDPTVVDEFSIMLDADTVMLPAEGGATKMRHPDNVAIGKKSLMVQEDTSDAKVWRYSFAKGTWSHVATATWGPAETSGIIDVSKWFGSGWWALDVQQHEVSVGDLDPTSEDPADWYTWPLFIPGGQQYRYHREAGQLLLMFIPAS